MQCSPEIFKKLQEINDRQLLLLFAHQLYHQKHIHSLGQPLAICNNAKITVALKNGSMLYDIKLHYCDAYGPINLHATYNPGGALIPLTLHVHDILRIDDRQEEQVFAAFEKIKEIIHDYQARYLHVPHKILAAKAANALFPFDYENIKKTHKKLQNFFAIYLIFYFSTLFGAMSNQYCGPTENTKTPTPLIYNIDLAWIARLLIILPIRDWTHLFRYCIGQYTAPVEKQDHWLLKIFKGGMLSTFALLSTAGIVLYELRDSFQGTNPWLMLIAGSILLRSGYHLTAKLLYNFIVNRDLAAQKLLTNLSKTLSFLFLGISFACFAFARNCFSAISNTGFVFAGLSLLGIEHKQQVLSVFRSYLGNPVRLIGRASQRKSRHEEPSIFPNVPETLVGGNVTQFVPAASTTCIPPIQPLVIHTPRTQRTPI